ncbi:hypothetical protein I8752_00855 [Nostocaceae cyanobacterium CENA369]|uniref:Uncharacterized protein n=1 Tax=Dendronalium phyllosphericum CENA369 TaxID=1725256 RepID=A0A8J7LB66_9NOST|nr:COP23 domain-containing protein [Dendronalium phyllosphericum]MBH8571597.1 hypothetical protein [Dendronalium phyllosphericum CENA369]
MNKWQSWVNVGILPILTLGAMAGLSAPSVAGNVQVSCQTNASMPTVIVTLVLDKVRNYPIFNFLPKYFSAAEAVQDCQNAAKSLQMAYDTGDYKYLTTDKLNDRPVVCAIERRGVGCNHYSAQVLFTFNPTNNPSQALYEMLGSDFKQAQPPDVRTISRTYTDTKPSWWPWP